MKPKNKEALAATRAQKHDQTRQGQYTRSTTIRKRWAGPAELLTALAEAIATVKRCPLLLAQTEPRLQLDRGPVQWRLPQSWRVA